MSKEFTFIKDAMCDRCNKTGAYDIYGDYVCVECMGDWLSDTADESSKLR